MVVLTTIISSMDIQTDSIKQTILVAAGKKFAEKGFARTTVREICEAAQVNLAAVNYHFGDKDRLYFQTVKWARKSRADANPLPGDDVDRRSRLRSFILTMVKRTGGVDEPSWEVQLLCREILFPTEACRQLIEEYFRPFFLQLIDIVREFSPGEMSEPVGYRLGYSIIGQVMYLRFTAEMKSIFLMGEMIRDHFQIEQIAEHIYQFSLAALESEDFWAATTKATASVPHRAREPHDN